jgi:hypothetical protein
VVSDFPLLSGADKAAWLCLVLSLIGRVVVAGCVPLFAVTANIRGAGKTLLVDVASVIAYGRQAAKETFTRDSDELRKKITTIALEGRPFCLWDNIDGKLGGAALDAALTATSIQDRILGKSQSTGEIPLKVVFAASGNNLHYGSDIARRVLPIRLMTPDERPEERENFEQRHLLEYVDANRAELAVAALTILRAYFVAGCPEVDLKTWGSFESWNRVIRAAVLWAGIGDAIETREHAKSQDDSAELAGLLIEGLKEADNGDGLTAKEICDLVLGEQAGTVPTLSEAVRMVCGAKVNPKHLGYVLRQYMGRTVANHRIIYQEGRGRVRKWRAEVVTMATMVTILPPVPTREAPPPLLSGTDRNHCHHRHHRHQTENDTQSGPGSRICQRCGGSMVPAREIGGWRNFDCASCGAVEPVEVAGEVIG